ncbi:hypothetical protein JOD01_003188 [Brevibacillus fulvus]|uniref:Uncharacterized protein n=1 Tax=Brevibacillus fulvus TaxID=1125967 RepID=A0A938Y4P0_9BACL|nr:hypothetical protein [Brevibacillus fulvus]
MPLEFRGFGINFNWKLWRKHLMIYFAHCIFVIFSLLMERRVR